jgi:hypothetical protein
MNGWAFLYQEHRRKIREAKLRSAVALARLSIIYHPGSGNLISKGYLKEALNDASNYGGDLFDLRQQTKVMVRARKDGMDPVVWRLSHGG